MILLDTNVISEPLRHTPEPRVIEWIDAQAMETLFLSSITVAELRAGVALLPAGKRRRGSSHGRWLHLGDRCGQRFRCRDPRHQPVQGGGHHRHQSVDTGVILAAFSNQETTFLCS